MKQQLRTLVEAALRRLPLARAAYVQRDALQARLDALLAVQAAAAPAPPPESVPGLAPELAPELAPAPAQPPVPTSLTAAGQVAGRDAYRLEAEIPVLRSLDDRIVMATLCRDADALPKVAGAGSLATAADGTPVQIMFNGIEVLAGGYYGDWMADLITRCRGHHEPQEEVLFAEVLRHLPPDAAMIELGGFWSFYSLWFLSGGAARRSVVVEADPAHLAVGRTNARLNGCAPTFVMAYAAGAPKDPAPFMSEASGLVHLPGVSVASLMQSHGIDHLDLLHCDAQGAELEVLGSLSDLAAAGRLGWVVVSTHSQHITGDALTHQRCLALLQASGATILAEHDVQESFSGDGLIVARFGPVPPGWRMPALSYNRPSESLFRNPLYDLALASAAPRPAAAPSPASPSASADSPAGAALATVAASPDFRAEGALLCLTADGALGRAGEHLLLPFDATMFPMTVGSAGWGLETLAFLDRRLDPAQRYVSLDIGANVGLYTRQVGKRFAQIQRFVCVEADPGNFRALQFNLGEAFGARARLWNLALSDADGEQAFFRDTENFGNYSLNADAMRARPFDKVVVRAVETTAWMTAKLALLPGEKVVWKSDTQGYDELIISRTPWSVWDRVDVAIVELWRIAKPGFDRAAFAARMDAFPHRTIGGRPSTTQDILAYLDGDDWDHADLYMWR